MEHSKAQALNKASSNNTNSPPVMKASPNLFIPLLLILILVLFMHDSTAYADQDADIRVRGKMLDEITKSIEKNKKPAERWLKHEKKKEASITYFQVTLKIGKGEVMIQYFPKEEKDGVEGCVNFFVTGDRTVHSFTSKLTGEFIGTSSIVDDKIIKAVYEYYK
jgi:hypothetical protein